MTPHKNDPKENLRSLFLFKLSALNDIETHLAKALPKLSRAATDKELQKAFDEHAKETSQHVERIRRSFSLTGQESEKIKVEGIRGITEDAEWTIREIKDEEVKDAALIAAAQYAEHYEMAGYSSAIEWSRILGFDEITDLLSETLEEEEAASRKLEELALSGINERANVGMSEEM